MSEVEGLRAWISSVKRSDGKLKLTYNLCFVKDDGKWKLKGLQGVYICVLDGEKKEIAKLSELIVLSEPFVRARTKSCQVNLDIELPGGARYISVALGTSGLVTRPVALPNSKSDKDN